MARRLSASASSPWAPPASPDALAPGESMYTSIPVRPASFSSEVVVPVFQALISGALGSGLLVFLARQAGYSGDWRILFGGLALLIACAMWAVLTMRRERGLWAIEERTGADLNGDGIIGRPTQPVEEQLVLINAPKAQSAADERWRREHRSQFYMFVESIPTLGTDIRTWEERGISRATLERYRIALMGAGWARWRSYNKATGMPNTTKGWELCIDVDEALARIV